MPGSISTPILPPWAAAALALAAAPLATGAEVLFSPGDAGDMTPSSSSGGSSAPGFSFTPGLGWSASRSESPATATLTTPPLAVTTGTGSIVLTIIHEFDFEFSEESSPGSPPLYDAFDGGRLRMRLPDGTAVAVNSWAEGGYSMLDELDGVDGLGYTPGWWGQTEGPLTSAATLGGLAPGTVISFEFEAGWDVSVARPAPNWTLHSLEVEGLAVIPEPSTAAALAAGFLLTLAHARRRR